MCGSDCDAHSGSQLVTHIPSASNGNNLRLTEVHQNLPIIVKSELRNRRLEHVGLTKPGTLRRLTGETLELAHEQSAGQVAGWVCNLTDPIG